MRMATALDPLSLPAERILVIAPHPDDETLGCGGLIAALCAAGRAFHIVFVTDGGASHTRSRDWPRERLAGQREAEAEEALARLGAAGQARTFLRLHDADMPARGSPAWRDALEQLSGIVAAFRPDLVLVPWRRDPHRDHRDSWRLTMDALQACGAAPETLEYAIWLDELGAPEDRPAPGEAELIAFDIADAVARKRDAVAAHLSQTTGLIADDPSGFRLSPETIDRLTGPVEAYWRATR